LDPYVKMYPAVSSKEINLREEMTGFMSGAYDEIGKGRTGLIRIMRKDSDGNLVRCPCRDNISDEQDRDFYCRFCLGMGYFWDEYEMLYHKNEESLNSDGFLFYLKYEKEISDKDYIVEIKLDVEGNPAAPIERKKLYNIIKSKEMRSDRGRREFWQLRALEELKWSTHYGVKHRQY